MEFNLGFKIGQDDSYYTIPPNIVPVWSKSFPSNLSLTHHHDEDNHAVCNIGTCLLLCLLS
jgi:hypothetical protein